MVFSASEPAELFISHVEDHVVKMCPICTQEFQPDDATYIIHVNMCLANNEQREHEQQQQQPRQEPQLQVPANPAFEEF